MTMPKQLKPLTHDEWKAKAIRLYGTNPLAWKFKCPSCGHVASVQDYKDAGASPGEIGFSCIGRALGAKKKIGDKTGGPCNYAGAGLFRLNPQTVTFEDGSENYFDFADQEA